MSEEELVDSALVPVVSISFLRFRARLKICKEIVGKVKEQPDLRYIVHKYSDTRYEIQRIP